MVVKEEKEKIKKVPFDQTIGLRRQKKQNPIKKEDSSTGSERGDGEETVIEVVIQEIGEEEEEESN